MKRCVIFAGAVISDYDELPIAITAEDYIICADAGLKHAQVLNISPDLIVGDFDSCDLKSFSPSEQKVIRFPSEKDDTDTLIAIREGISRGYQEFVLLGCLGGRIDHTLANIQSLLFLKEHGCHGVLYDEAHEIFLHYGGTMRLSKRENRYLSILALTPVCKGVTLKGVKYPLTDYTMQASFPIGVSNQFTQDIASITIDEGIALILLTKDL